MERAVRVTPRGLDLGTEEIPLLSGSIHYWRLDPKLWDHLLDECREMGFRVLCTYVPWVIHELEKGKFDFGEKKLEKDLGAFLDLAHSKGLKFIVRAGPHINSELTYFGYPKRVLLDPKNQARSASGTGVVLPIPPRMFPVPSHFSKNFQDDAQTFLEALSPIVRPRLHPQGPIVLLQIDNEWSYFFRYSAYEQDYSEGALAEYRDFLKGRYPSISALNSAYGTNYSSFKEAVPPKKFGARKLSDWPPYLDWVEAREKMHQRGLALVKERYERAGLAGVATSHNFPVPFPQSPLDVSACEEVVDIQGTDHYPKKTDYASLKKEGCLLSGSSRLPFIPEFSSGFFPVPGYPILLEDERFTTLALFMHGLKAINFYMLVERERWAGSPLTRDGRRREELFGFYKRLNEVLARTQLHRLPKRRECVLLTNPDALRITRAASVLPITNIVVDVGAVDGEMLVDERDLGFRDKIQIEYGRTFESLFRALSQAHIPFDIANPETVSEERLSRYRT
ncbi:MAG: beta-galactosidase, partial [Bdellovibrionota bacterium]